MARKSSKKQTKVVIATCLYADRFKVLNAIDEAAAPFARRSGPKDGMVVVEMSITYPIAELEKNPPRRITPPRTEYKRG